MTVRFARDAARSPTHWNTARQGTIHACIIYRGAQRNEFLSCFAKTIWYKKKTLVDNFKRAIMEAKHVNEFRLARQDVLWEKISKGLLKSRSTPENTDKRMEGFEPFDQMLYHQIYCWKPHDLPDPGWNPLHLVDGSKTGCLVWTLSPEEPPELTISQIPDPTCADPELTTPKILLSDPPPVPIPPELTTPQILLPDPPPELTTPQILLQDLPPAPIHLSW
ncbi:hypothetical protein TNCV_3645991 [Trichonephila clavipes]|nr:hypothetical protein TNCV_3645991 [Trichonephila clavipes]